MSEPSRGYAQLLRENRAYRYLWLAQVVSFLGDWFNTIALYTAVQQLGGSTEAVAGVFVAKTLPMFAVTPITGPIIDRFDRRKLMIATDVGRAVCALGLVVAYRAGSLPGLMIVLVIMVALSGLFVPARTASLPQLTSPSELAAANALGGGTWSVMLALGAATGGLVTSWLGVEQALICDAATFLLSALLLLPLPALLPRAAGPSERTGFVDGVRYLWRRPYLAALISLKAAMSLTAGAVALIPVFARDVLGRGGPGGIAILYTSRGFGALLGALLIRRIFGDAPATMRRMIVAGLLLLGGSYMAVSSAVSLPAAAFGYFSAAVGGGLVWVFSGTLSQFASDNAYRGRVFSMEWGGLTLSMSSCAWLAGAAMDRAGWSIRQVVRVSGALALLPALLWALLLVARIPERHPEPARDER